MPEEKLDSKDLPPQPAAPEELTDFKTLASKLLAEASHAKKEADETFGTTTTGCWRPRPELKVQLTLGSPGDPGAVDVLTSEYMGAGEEIDSEVTKHYRYFPHANSSEYEEELVESHKGNLLVDEQTQRMRDAVRAAGPGNEARAIREFAEENEQEESDIPDVPELTQDQVDEIMSVLESCGPQNEVAPS